MSPPAPPRCGPRGGQGSQHSLRPPLPARSPPDCSITKFLNRILGLEVHKQNALFQYFSDTFDHLIEADKKEGKYDMGILGEHAVSVWQMGRLRPVPGQATPPPGQGAWEWPDWGGRGLGQAQRAARVLPVGCRGSPSRVSPENQKFHLGVKPSAGCLVQGKEAHTRGPHRGVAVPPEKGPVSVSLLGGWAVSDFNTAVAVKARMGLGSVPGKLHSSNQRSV